MTIAGSFDDAFFFKNLKIAVYLVISAVDYPDEICDMGLFVLGESHQYFLSARRRYDLLQSRFYTSPIDPSRTEIL